MEAGAYQGSNPVEFNRLSQLVSSNIQKIQQNVSQIQRFVDQVGTTDDSEMVRSRLHEIVHSTNALARDTSRMLKELNNAPVTERQVKLQKERLTNDLMVVLNNFQSAQRTAAEKEKASVSRARALSGIESDDPFSSQRVSERSAFEQLPPAQRLQIEQNVDTNALKEREHAIEQLESDIVDVNTIFKDLALMVHEQGEIVDSIEHNVESSVVNVQQAQSQIQQAARYQSSARKKKLICFVLLVIIIAIIIIVLAVEFGGNKN